MPKPTQAAELLVRCRVVLCKFCDLSRAAPTHRVSSSNAHIAAPNQKAVAPRNVERTWESLSAIVNKPQRPKIFCDRKNVRVVDIFRRFALPKIRACYGGAAI